MHQLRFSFVCVVAAVLLLSGMTIGMIDDCHFGSAKSCEHGKVPSQKDGCHCICAHGQPEIPFAFATLVVFSAGELELIAAGAEAPPEPVPAGIDYPPQLA